MLLPVFPVGIASATDALQESYSANVNGAQVVYGNGSAGKWAAQTFIPVATYSLTSVKIRAWTAGTPGNVSVYITPTVYSVW